MAEYDGDIKLRVTLTPEDAIKSAKRLQKSVEDIFKATSGKNVSATFKSMENGLSNSYTKSQKLVASMEKLADQKIPTPQYTELQKQFNAIEAKSSRMIKRQMEMEELGKSNTEAWRRLDHQIEKLGEDSERVLGLMSDMEDTGKAFVFGSDTTQYQKMVSDLEAVNNQMLVQKTRIEQSKDGMRLLSEATTQSADISNEKIAEMNAELEGLKQKQKELSAQGQGLGYREYDETTQRIREVESELKSYQSELNRTDDVQKKMQKSSGKLGSVFSKIAKGIGNLVKNGLSKLRRGFSNAKSGIDSTAKSMRNSLKHLIAYAFGIRTLFTVFSNLKSYAKEAFSELAKQSTKVDADISRMRNAFGQLKNSIATAFQPILSIISPVVTQIIHLMTQAMNAVGSFFAVLTGQKFIYKAVESNESYAASLDKSTDSVKKNTKAVEDNQKQLGNYDKLNVIEQDKDKDKSPSGGGGGAGAGGPMFEEAEIEPAISAFAEKIKEAWRKADFTEIGVILGEKLRDALNSIPWEPIQGIAEKIGKSLGTLIAGFVSVPGLPEAIGNAIGQALNTLLLGLNTFIKNVPWEKLGEFLAKMLASGLLAIDKNGNTLIANIADYLKNVINVAIDSFLGFVETLPWYKIGEEIGKSLGNAVRDIHWENLGKGVGLAINGLFDLLLGFTKNFPFAEFGTSIAAAINTAIYTIDWMKNGKTLGMFVSGLFTALRNFIETTDWGALGKGIVEFIVGFFKGFDWGEFAGTLSSLIDALRDFLAGAISGVDWESLPRDIVNAIVSAFKGINWKQKFKSIGNLAGTILKAVWDLGKGLVEVVGDVGKQIADYFSKKFKEAGFDKNKGFLENGKAIIQGLLNGIWEALKGIGTWILNNIFKPFWDGICSAFGIASPSKKMMEIGKYIVQGLIDGVKSLINNVKQIFTNVWATIKNVFSNPRQFFSDKFKNAFTAMKNAFSSVKSAFSSVWSNIKNAFSGTKNWFGSTFNDAWQKVKEKFSISNVKIFFGKVWSGIKEAFGKIPKWFKDKFSDAWQKVKDVFSSGGKVFSGIKDGILSSLKAVINGLISGINKVVAIPFNGLNSALNKLKNISIVGQKPFSFLPSISVPQIPRLAQGAVIPPNKEFLAMLGDQKQGTNIETPLETMIEAFRTALDEREKNTTNNQSIVLQLDGRTVAEVVWDETEKKYKQLRSGTMQVRYL